MDQGIAILCDAAEEWAQVVEETADDIAALGQVGREVAPKIRADAVAIKEAITQFRPLRSRNADGEWAE